MLNLGLCPCENMAFHPSWCNLPMWGSMLWFEKWLEGWRWLIPSWQVVLESAMDRILGVDTSEQHVPSRVWYGTTCLLIRNTAGRMSCPVEWGVARSVWYTVCIAWTTWCKRGHVVGILSVASRARMGNRSKAWQTPIVNLYNDM
jgi:hypothetical protein